MTENTAPQASGDALAALVAKWKADASTAMRVSKEDNATAAYWVGRSVAINERAQILEAALASSTATGEAAECWNCGKKDHDEVYMQICFECVVGDGKESPVKRWHNQPPQQASQRAGGPVCDVAAEPCNHDSFFDEYDRCDIHDGKFATAGVAAEEACEKCGKTELQGYHVVDQHHNFHRFQPAGVAAEEAEGSAVCGMCGGTGEYVDDEGKRVDDCDTCNGTGKLNFQPATESEGNDD